MSWLIKAGTVGKAGKGEVSKLPHINPPPPLERKEPANKAVSDSQLAAGPYSGAHWELCSQPQFSSVSLSLSDGWLFMWAMWVFASYSSLVLALLKNPHWTAGSDTTALYQPGSDDDVKKTQTISYIQLILILPQLSLPSRAADRSTPAERLQPAQTPRWSTGGRWSPPAAPHLDKCRPRSAEEECFNQSIIQETTNIKLLQHCRGVNSTSVSTFALWDTMLMVGFSFCSFRDAEPWTSTNSASL